MELYRSLPFDAVAFAKLSALHQEAARVYIEAHNAAFLEALRMRDVQAGVTKPKFHPWYIVGQTIDEPFEQRGLFIDSCILTYRAHSIKELIEAGQIEHRQVEGEDQYRLVARKG